MEVVLSIYIQKYHTVNYIQFELKKMFPTKRKEHFIQTGHSGSVEVANTFCTI